MALRDFRSVISQLAADPTMFTKQSMVMQARVTAPTAPLTPSQLTPGTCSSDGSFVWAITADGTGYWRRRAVNEACATTLPPGTGPGPSGTSTSSGAAPGGVSVTTTDTMRTRRAQFTEKLRDFLTQQVALDNEIVALIPACSETLDLAKSPWTTALISRGPAGKLGWANDLYHSPADVATWTSSLSVADFLRLNPALWRRSPIPNSFFIFGVPFALTERKEATYSKSFAPSVLQKWLVDFQIVVASNSGDTIDDDTRRLKVADALAQLNSKGLHYTTNLAGFSVNPMQPTATQTLGDYLSKGGYLIDLDRVYGKKRIGSVPNGRLGCSTFCKDPASGLPYCIETANLSGDADTVSTWEVYVTVGANYTITLKYKEYDPSWWVKAASTVGGLMQKFHEQLCTPGTDTNKYATQAVGAASSKSSDPYVKAWAAGMQWELSECAKLYAPKTPITQVVPETPTATTPVAPVVAPVAPTITAVAPKYQGCVSRFHKTQGVFSVYCPVDWKPSGFGTDVSPAPPSGTVKVASLPVAPPEAPNVGTEDDPLYKKWQFWAIIGSAVVAGGVGTYASVRYRRRHRAA